MPSLSKMISEVRSQAIEVNSLVGRLRLANRRLSGATGEAPTQLNSVKGPTAPEPDRPLLEQLNVELERLNSATADLRSEVNHVETYSETGETSETPNYANQGVASAGFASGRL